MGLSRKTALGRRKRRRRSPWQHALAPSAKVAAPAAVAKRVLGSSRRPSGWKLIGLAGIAGVAATGVVVARQRRARTDLPPDELRERLHERLAAVGGEGDTPAATEPAAAEPGSGEPRP
jgi:hypothetical protein